jgi:hypothetical protein
LVLGVLRRLAGAPIIARLLPPHPAHVVSAGCGGEALGRAILEGDHALDQGGRRLEARGMMDWLAPGLTGASLHDYRFGHSLEALFAAKLNAVVNTVARKVLAVYALPTPWLHQDPTTLALYGAYADAPPPPKAPRPAYGPRKDGREALQQGLLRLGVPGESGLPLRGGRRAGNRSDSVAPPLAIAACLALGLDGGRGIGADRQAYSRRPWGLGLARGLGVVTLVPRTWAVRQELDARGGQPSALPLVGEKPGRTQAEEPRRWPGQSVFRQGAVESRGGRGAQAPLRFVVGHASQLAQQSAPT